MAVVGWGYVPVRAREPDWVAGTYAGRLGIGSNNASISLTENLAFPDALSAIPSTSRSA